MRRRRRRPAIVHVLQSPDPETLKSECWPVEPIVYNTVMLTRQASIVVGVLDDQHLKATCIEAVITRLSLPHALLEVSTYESESNSKSNSRSKSSVNAARSFAPHPP